MSDETRMEPVPSWREVMWPKEHGSWSLAFEPLALALLVAPSVAGACLALAAAAGFFLRRPVRGIATETRPAYRPVVRRVVVVLGTGLLLAAVGAYCSAGVSWAWLLWLGPSAVAGLVFVQFDLRKSGREAQAEFAGSVAFAWLPAVFAVLAGWSSHAAVALAAVMLARSVPTVLTVRAVLRARKNRIRPAAWPALVAGLAAAGIGVLAWNAWSPWTAFALAAVLAVRSVVLLVFPRPNLRASVLGMGEAALGIVYVLAIAWAWQGAA